jgi:hypothetical protein
VLYKRGRHQTQQALALRVAASLQAQILRAGRPASQAALLLLLLLLLRHPGSLPFPRWAPFRTEQTHGAQVRNTVL